MNCLLADDPPREGETIRYLHGSEQESYKTENFEISRRGFCKG